MRPLCRGGRLGFALGRFGSLWVALGPVSVAVSHCRFFDVVLLAESFAGSVVSRQDARGVQKEEGREWGERNGKEREKSYQGNGEEGAMGKWCSSIDRKRAGIERAEGPHSGRRGGGLVVISLGPRIGLF